MQICHLTIYKEIFFFKKYKGKRPFKNDVKLQNLSDKFYYWKGAGTVGYFEYFNAKMVTLEYIFVDSNAGFLHSRTVCYLLPIGIIVKRTYPIN
jgi:hypothetical protein